MSSYNYSIYIVLKLISSHLTWCCSALTAVIFVQEIMTAKPEQNKLLLSQLSTHLKPEQKTENRYKNCFKFLQVISSHVVEQYFILV